MSLVRLRRRVRKAGKSLREARMLVRALQHPDSPVAVHLIPIRRCNLACTYCNEFDDHSPPVATSLVLERIDRLAALGTGIVTLSGGEPLLHPEVDQIIRHIRRRGMLATLITNGYLLSRDRIRRLNRAGLDHLQISIDNVLPDAISKKSLKVLDQKLRWLAELGEFDVTINSVVGAGIRNPGDAVMVTRRARALGFSTTAGILHDAGGGLLPLDPAQRKVLEEIVATSKGLFDYANYNRFQKNLASGQPNDWHCRAGARYLYVCEDGLVHWCSQQRGTPGIPLDRYGADDLRREAHRVKSCAPFCTVGCVHRVAQVDDLRTNAEAALAHWFAAPLPGARPHLPLAIKMLRWAFITGPQRDLLRRAAVRVFRADQSGSV
jgi:MoaA/NifB/PqqE/SkfB family radical SAM enzyme